MGACKACQNFQLQSVKTTKPTHERLLIRFLLWYSGTWNPSCSFANTARQTMTGSALSLLMMTAGITSAAIEVRPQQVVLESPEASQQIVVTSDGVDVTRAAEYRVGSKQIVDVNSHGLITPNADGEAVVTIEFAGKTLKLPVEANRIAKPRPVSFRNEIIPILTKARCNSGGCHGKAEGQNGLS